MAVQVEPRNDAVDAMTPYFVSISLHTGDPGSSGDNELTGDNYSRETADWSSASDASASITQDLVYQVSAGNEITHIGMWDSDDVWAGSVELDNPQPFVNDGELTVKTLSVTINNM